MNLRAQLLSSLVLPPFVLVALPAWAQTAADLDAVFDRYERSTIETRTAQIRQIEDAYRTARLGTARASSPALATANASTAVDLAQAALSTSVAGADAGATVNPLALAGQLDSPWQSPLTVAALKGGLTRLQAGVVYQIQQPLPELLPGCTVDQKDLRRQMEAIRDPFKSTCAAVALLPFPDPLDDVGNLLRRDLRRACGLEPEGPQTLSTATVQITKILSSLVEKYDSDPELRNAFDHAGSLAQPLAAYREAAPDDCQTTDALGNEAVRAIWIAQRIRIAVSVRGDFYNRAFGFNPDPTTKLPDGRTGDEEVRFEVFYGKKFMDASIGIGGGVARASFSDPRVGYVSPAASLAWTVARLSSESLRKSGQLNVVDGALPPRMVLGIDVLARYAPRPPATLVTSWSKVAITAYADFRFSDKLTVRVGAPLAADVVVQKADASKGISERRDLQWTIPVFVATVLKI